MAEPKLDLKGFGSEKKSKRSLLGVLLVLIGFYYLIQNRVDVLSGVYYWVTIAVIVIGVIVYFVGRK